MSEAANAPVGQTIEGRYRIVRRIAEGGMATVYQAIDERLDRTVAIKVMHTQLARGPHRDQFVERFRREAKSAAAIANAHIVQVYDTGEFNGLDYLVMEYVHGVNLRHEMNTQGTFSVRETLRIVMETLDGLAAAHHAGVVHRDIKPENILINDRGHVQITDFGLAKAASQATLSSTGMLLGTAAYLAPEMIERNEATPQGDLYSVGIMAWEMLAGQVPFVSDNPVTLVFKHVHEDVPSVTGPCPGIDAGVAGFIAHLTAREVGARPADASAAYEELRRLSGTLDMGAWKYRLDPSGNGTSTDSADGSVDDDATRTMVGGSPVPPVPPADMTATAAYASAPAVTSPLVTAPSPDATSSSNADVPSSHDPAATQTLGHVPAFLAEEAASSADPSATQTLPAPQVEMTRAMPADGPAAATQAITLAGDGTDATSAIDLSSPDIPGAPGGSPDKPAKRWKKPLAITLAVVLALGACGGGGAWWYYLGPGSYWTLPQPTDIDCADGEACPVTDADWQSYKSTLDVAAIPYQVRQAYSDDVAKGRIIKTDPADVGAHVGKRNGEKVVVTVSRGVRMATIPEDITDPNSTNGKDPIGALTRAGFTNIKRDEAKEEYSLDKPEGTLVSIDQEPGARLKHNEAITVILSKGPMPVSMPDVVGKSRDDMQAAFDENKLTANITEQFDDKIPAGQVISASQQAGAQLKWGDSVDVVVSKGPETVTIQNYVGQKASAAKSALEQLGFTVSIDEQAKITLDSSKDKTVASQNPTGGSVVRLRDENGKPTVVTLKMYASLL